jgi:hypothetical protein
VVEEDQRGIGRGCDGGDFLDFAFAEERGRIRFRPPLRDFADNQRARAENQLAEFAERRFGIEV